MIRLDDRAGSSALYTPLLSLGLPVHLTRLQFGDLAWEGNGPDGIPYLIGVEHKQVADVLKCIQDGRFAGHQLPGLLEAYNVVYLLVEGQTRMGRDGALQVRHSSGRYFDQTYGNRTYRYSEFYNWLTTIELKAGIHLRMCTDQPDSINQLGSLYRWWTDKMFDAHRAHLAFDEVSDACRVAILNRPTTVRRIAKELPGIGWERSAAVARTFRSVVDMVAASEAEWCAIDGIGRVMAKRIMRELGSDKLYDTNRT